MNNKYFAVFLPSLGIDEKLFHLGELIMKISAVFYLHVGDSRALTCFDREVAYAWTRVCIFIAMYRQYKHLHLTPHS